MDYYNGKRGDYNFPSWFLDMYILIIGETLYFVWQFNVYTASCKTPSQRHRALSLNWYFNVSTGHHDFIKPVASDCWDDACVVRSVNSMTMSSLNESNAVWNGDDKYGIP